MSTLTYRLMPILTPQDADIYAESLFEREGKPCGCDRQSFKLGVMGSLYSRLHECAIAQAEEISRLKDQLLHYQQGGDMALEASDLLKRTIDSNVLTVTQESNALSLHKRIEAWFKSGEAKEQAVESEHERRQAAEELKWEASREMEVVNG